MTLTRRYVLLISYVRVVRYDTNVAISTRDVNTERSISLCRG